MSSVVKLLPTQYKTSKSVKYSMPSRFAMPLLLQSISVTAATSSASSTPSPSVSKASTQLLKLASGKYVSLIGTTTFTVRVEPFWML